ncbi:hypothetical protein KZO01_26220 [Kurthia zopfii]|uniref:Uncharacterized protein n=1 Tax=Kurthia zopfii TaxID=1650 RepID=A0A8B4QAC8_9BACL|nr:hypothetical protein [Kurthia zopfii]PWI21122.1 hypothetical protein DF281_13870 [Kurthia zopfii]TDR32618.1 hypothetical protein DFR61_16210 [Kurthia zopfii]GEK32313.1 hypothetical protein KZO01_26220 [Kurthia zopfii]STX09652.1 Uncharacterised protein [Kurthia zopfii]
MEQVKAIAWYIFASLLIIIILYAYFEELKGKSGIISLFFKWLCLLIIIGVLITIIYVIIGFY